MSLPLHMRDCDHDARQSDYDDHAAEIDDTLAALIRVGLDRVPEGSELEVQGAVPVRAGTYVAWSSDTCADVTRARALRPACASIRFEPSHLRFVEAVGRTAHVIAESIHLRAESALVIDAGVRELVLQCARLTVEPGAWIRWDPVIGSRDAPKLTIHADEIEGALPTIALRGADGGDGGEVRLVVDRETGRRLQRSLDDDRRRVDVRPGVRLLTPFGRFDEEATAHAAAGKIGIIEPRPRPSPAAPRAAVLPVAMAMAMAIGDTFYVIAANAASALATRLGRG